MIPLLDLPRLHAPMRDELIAAFKGVLDSGRYILGNAVEQFEDALAQYVGAKHAIGVSSGTDALLVSLMALGVKPGDEVITTPFTFFATVGAIARLGARPVFVDIHPDTLQIDETRIEDAVTDRTAGIIPVHLFGGCAQMEPILDAAERRGLWVIEDTAQSLGALHKGRMAGTSGTAGIYSFFPAKNLGALGDAGAVVTGDSALAEKIRTLRSHGAKQKYHHELIGGNFRMDTLQAALLQVKLPRLHEWECRRRAVADRYRAALGDVEGIRLLKEPQSDQWVANPFVLLVQRRNEVVKALRERHIENAVYYEEPLHLCPALSSLGHQIGDFPSAEAAARQSLALSADPALPSADQDIIIETVLRTVRDTLKGQM